MNRRKIGAWAGRLLLAAGIVAAALLGPQSAQASAADVASDSGVTTTMLDPAGADPPGVRNRSAEPTYRALRGTR